MDDVAQTAVEARIQAANAHARLDGINGQIRRLGNEQAQTRVDIATQFGEVKTELAKVKTRVGVYAGVGAFMATAIMGPLAVALAIHFMPPPRAAQATVDKRPSAATVGGHDVSVAEPRSTSQRGSHERVSGSHGGHSAPVSHDNPAPTQTPPDPGTLTDDVEQVATDVLAQLPPIVSPGIALP